MVKLFDQAHPQSWKLNAAVDAFREHDGVLSPGGKPISGPFRVLEFDTPAGIASPILRTNPGFIGGGRTAGGAREFVIPNYSADSLLNLTMRTVN